MVLDTSVGSTVGDFEGSAVVLIIVGTDVVIEDGDILGCADGLFVGLTEG